MRISDWSSDVCSSDLRPAKPTATDHNAVDAYGVGPIEADRPLRRRMEGKRVGQRVHADIDGAACRRERLLGLQDDGKFRQIVRSEEHTSELQSLMRTSYAVFCLKKKHTDKRPKYQQKAT